MAISDIKNASSVKQLLKLMKNTPVSFSSSVIKLFTMREHEARKEYLKKLPEDMLRNLVKMSTYLLLASGVVLKESVAEMYLTPEIQDFLDKVKKEVDKTGEMTREAVSAAVDLAIGTVSAVSFIGLISLMVFLMMNPAIAASAASASLLLMLLGDMIHFLMSNNSSHGT